MSTSNFPLGLDSWTNPGGSDLENSAPVPHHLQHAKANDALAAIQKKIGIDGSNDATSLDYLSKAAANPGHTHTNSISVNSITLTGTAHPSGGPGAWTDGTNIFVSTAGSTGGILLRPNGPTSTSHQFSISSSGVVATASSVGAISNTLDDGAGNVNITGNTTVVGSLTVNGSFSTGSFVYGLPSNSLVTDTASIGNASSLSRSDHVHGREGFVNTLPLSNGTAASGTSPHPAHQDHVHPLQGETTGIIKMWPTNTAPAGYLMCDGSSYSTASQVALFAVLQYTYGGSGANFNVPDFRGVSPIGAGTGTHVGITPRTLGTFAGSETHAIAVTELPAHQHPLPSLSHAHGPNTSSITGGPPSHDHTMPQNILIQVGSDSGNAGQQNLEGWGSGGEGVIVWAAGQTSLESGGIYAGTIDHVHTVPADLTGALATSNSAASSATTPIVGPSLAINFIIKN